MLLTGNDSEYRAIHRWVDKQLGKPMFCQDCKVVGRSRYHWANISQRYLKVTSDWKRLCVSCHKKLDFQHRPMKPRVLSSECRQGHPLTPDNVYFKKSRGVRECRICKSRYMQDFLKRKQAVS